MKNKILLTICLVAISMTACDKKEILPGKREAISGITVSEKTNISKQLAAQKINPKPAVTVSSIVDISGNKQHLSQNYKMPTNTKTLWKTSLGRGPVNSDIIAFGGNIYAIDGMGYLNCVSQNDGKIVWKKQVAPQPDDAVFSGGITANNGVIYVGTNIGKVIAIDSKNKKEIWSKEIKSPTKGAPLYVDGKVIVTAIDNQTFALDSSNGNIIWTKSSNKEDTTMAEAGSPAVIGNDLICAYSSGDIMSIENKTGSDNWSDVLFSSNISESGFVISDIAASPVVINNEYVLAATAESKTVLFDAISGIRVWEQDVGTITTPVINNDWVFMLTGISSVTCLSLKDGSIKWESSARNLFADKRYDSYKWSGPIMINGDIVIFSENGDAVTFDISTGKIKSQKIIVEKASIARTPIIIDGKIFTISNRAEIFAIG